MSFGGNMNRGKMRKIRTKKEDSIKDNREIKVLGENRCKIVHICGIIWYKFHYPLIFPVSICFFPISSYSFFYPERQQPIFPPQGGGHIFPCPLYWGSIVHRFKYTRTSTYISSSGSDFSFVGACLHSF
jgi:hypothetical protein